MVQLGITYNYIKTALDYHDGITKTDVRLSPSTLKQYPFFFSGYKYLYSFRDNDCTIQMELAGQPESLDRIGQRFADIHSVTEFSPPACYLIISQKFKELLSNFKICSHRFDPVKVRGLNEVRSYYLLHIPKPIDALDYDKSVFGIFNGNGPQQGFVELFSEGTINSKEHMMNFQDEYLSKYNKSPEFYFSKRSGKKLTIIRSIVCQKAVFKEAYDILAPIEGFGILVNEKVKKAIVASDLTGWEITPYEYKDFKIEMPESV